MITFVERPSKRLAQVNTITNSKKIPKSKLVIFHLNIWLLRFEGEKDCNKPSHLLDRARSNLENKISCYCIRPELFAVRLRCQRLVRL